MLNCCTVIEGCVSERVKCVSECVSEWECRKQTQSTPNSWWHHSYRSIVAPPAKHGKLKLVSADRAPLSLVIKSSRLYATARYTVNLTPRQFTPTLPAEDSFPL